jgi:hypothetical protein
MIRSAGNDGASHRTLRLRARGLDAHRRSRRRTACNCTVCRRYGALWAYDDEGGRIARTGEMAALTRARKNPVLEFRFCPACACVVAWRGLRLEEDGRRRIAVNVRLADPEAVADVSIDQATNW